MTVPETTPEPAEPGFLRDRMAAGRSCVCPHPTVEHSLYGCTHGCACEWLSKPAPVDVGLRDRVATALGTIAVVGGCPPQMVVPVLDGSNPRLARIADWQPLDRVIDAVLAVLPAPADRSAVLREVADILRGLRLTATAISAGELEADLRRLADEAQQPEAWPPSVSWRVETRWRDGTWRKYGPSWDTDHDWMKEHFARDSADTGRAFRLARATTTYTVETEGVQR